MLPIPPSRVPPSPLGCVSCPYLPSCEQISSLLPRGLLRAPEAAEARLLRSAPLSGFLSPAMMLLLSLLPFLMKVRVEKYVLASLADLGMNSSAEEPERPGPPVRGAHSRRGEASGRNYNLFFSSPAESPTTVSLCVSVTPPGRLGAFVGPRGQGGGRGTGEVLKLCMKAALRASKWREELALSGKSSMPSPAGHKNSLFQARWL